MRQLLFLARSFVIYSCESFVIFHLPSSFQSFRVFFRRFMKSSSVVASCRISVVVDFVIVRKSFFNTISTGTCVLFSLIYIVQFIRFRPLVSYVLISVCVFHSFDLRFRKSVRLRYLLERRWYEASGMNLLLIPRPVYFQNVNIWRKGVSRSMYQQWNECVLHFTHFAFSKMLKNSVFELAIPSVSMGGSCICAIVFDVEHTP